MSRRDPWFKFYPSDWLRDTRHLTLEQRGAYIDSIAIQMERGKAVPDDCSWLAHQMHISSRKARSIVTELVELKMLNRSDAGLSNPRCEKELAAREVQRVANAQTAFIRERSKREPALNQPRTSAEPELNQRPLNAEKSKKTNNIKEANTNSWHENSTTRARLESESDIEVEKKENNTGPPAYDAARDCGRALPEIGELNGATSQIVADFAGWINPYAPDLAMAHKSIADAVRLYGDRAVRDGYADLKADHADGKVRALSVKAFYGFVRTAKERGRSRQSGPKKPSRW